jgi:DNA-binding NarL/FixJ family response regulator
MELASPVHSGQRSLSAKFTPGERTMIDSGSNSEIRERAQRTLDAFRAAGSPRIRVVLADDHVLLRQSLRLLLEMHDEIAVIGDVDNGREAVETACTLNADVVLMDMRMPAMNGIEATRQIRKRSPKTHVLMLTGVTENEQVIEAVRAGASGYVLKQSGVNELIVAIQAVHRGNPYFSGALSHGGSATELLLAAQGTPRDSSDPLTAREREVLQLVAEGNSNKATANKLILSVKTVEAHKAHIMAKLRVQNQTDLIRYALRRGIISLDSGDEPSEGGGG